jgi:glycerate kinase
LRSGFEVVAERIGLAQRSRGGVVIHGEGGSMRRTAGKAPAGVAKLARRAAKRFTRLPVAFDGSTEVRELFDGVVTLVDAGTSKQTRC